MSKPRASASVVIAVIAACSATAKPRPRQQCAAESPAFELARGTAVETASEAPRRVDSVLLIPFPSKVMHERCAGIDELVRPFCFEGAAAAFGAAVAKALDAGDEVAIAGVESQFRLADNRWWRIHCRGFGNGLSDLAPARVDGVLAQLSPRCRSHVVDGFSNAKGWEPVPDVEECRHGDTPACRATMEALFTSFDVDAVCARWGPERDWCAYGTGRMLGNLFSSEIGYAAQVCHGGEACLAGVGFVAVYLYPDRIERALTAAVQLAPAEQVGFIEGVANALRWRQESDAAPFVSWVARLSPKARKLTTDILAAATSCGLVDFHSGVACRWPVLPAACDL